MTVLMIGAQPAVNVCGDAYDTGIAGHYNRKIPK